MKSERKTEIKVGITTIIALIVFIWIMGWAKNFMKSSNNIEIKLSFDNVSGLEIDDDVYVRGLRTGFVKDISLDKNMILVIISVDENVDLRDDAEFFLSTVDLMGDKKIEIIPGSSGDKLDFNIIQKGIFLPDLASMVSTVGEMKEDLNTIVGEVKISLSSLNSYLTDEKLKGDIKSSLKNLHSLTSKIDLMLDENRYNISQITDNTAVLSEDAKIFLHDNKENLTSSIVKMKDVFSKSDSFMTKLNFLTSETLESKNNLGKIMYDDSLMVEMKQTISNLRELVELMLQQLKDDGVKVDANIW